MKAEMKTQKRTILDDAEQYSLMELTEDQENKLEGLPEPGLKVNIHWHGEEWESLFDTGYLFAIPRYYKGCDDFFIHIPNPENPGGKDSVDDEWVHLNFLLSNERCKKVVVVNQYADQQSASLRQEVERLRGADRSDAEIFLSENKDIWNHPMITDRTETNSYEVADLMAEFNNWYIANATTHHGKGGTEG